MQKTLLALASLALLGTGGYYLYAQNQTGEPGGIACTMEAKLCPDGVTYVGRTGPKCEFAACPGPTSTPGTVVLEAALNQKITAFNFSITPLEVLEDSRCPIDVQCIQAGTVRLKAKLAGGLGEYTATLELNKPFINEEVSITLTKVSPLKTATHQISPDERLATPPIAPSAYIFTFTIEKRN